VSHETANEWLTIPTMSAPRLRLVLALALALPLDLACKRDQEPVRSPSTEDPIDSLTRNLLLTLRQHDEARLIELATPELADSLDGAARAELATTLEWLGAIDALTRLDEVAVSDGVERRYQLRFEHGEIELTVTTAGERVHGLQFDEAMWTQIVERAIAAAAGDLRVAEFAFTTAEGLPLKGALNPKAIYFFIAIEGLASNLREHEVSVAKAVFDGEGAQVYKEHEDEQLRIPEGEVGASGARITDSVAVPGKGSYELEIKVTDQIANVTIVHRQPFAVE
jgi:hypothetical protein